MSTPTLMQRFDAIRALEHYSNETVNQFVGAVSYQLEENPALCIGEVMRRFVEMKEREFNAALDKREGKDPA